jgi:DNA-binding LytR/AlgR family response regulator
LSVWSALLIAIIPVTIGYILTFNKIYRNALTGISGSDELFVPDEEIIFRAGNQKNEFRLNPKNILYLCSNDNYITIFTINGPSVVRTTIRGTLKNAEAELVKYKRFLRCHKCYIVNLDYVAGTRGNYQNMTIRLKHTDTAIPVSRSRVSTVAKVLKKI